MDDTIKLNNILKGSKHRLKLFRQEEVQELEERVTEKDGKYFAECLARQRSVQLKPEEVVRQLMLARLHKDYGYSFSDMKLEHPVRIGRDASKRADIVIFGRDNSNAEYIFVEVKKPNAKDGKGQLKSYCHATGAPIAVWSNGAEISYFNRIDPNHFKDIADIPHQDVTLEEFLEDDSNDPSHRAMHNLLEVSGDSHDLFLQHIGNFHHSLAQAQIKDRDGKVISLDAAVATSDQFRDIQRDPSRSVDEEFYQLHGQSLIRDTTNLIDPGHLVIKEIIEAMYKLRNKLFHGELVPDEHANAVYQHAYLIMSMLIPKLI